LLKSFTGLLRSVLQLVLHNHATLVAALRSRMITAIHTLVFSDDAAATRAFCKNVLQWPFVSEGERGDAGTGSGTGGQDPAEWLIFKTGPSELGVHPTASAGEPQDSPRHHSIAVMCDDLDATMAELSGRGAEFAGEAQEMGFGRGVTLQVPGADDMLLYQPHHATAYDLR
jgi:catechol 2,3-dioxygenase-like lactoylglutathione lyase family enzyme